MVITQWSLMDGICPTVSSHRQNFWPTFDGSAGENCHYQFKSCQNVLFDVYRDLSFKNVERNRRSKGQLLFKTIIATTQIKQWGSFLSCIENKNYLVEFFVSRWKNAESQLKIGQKPFYVPSRLNVYKINNAVIKRVLQLQSNHEETDTQILPHAKHASLIYSKVLISSPDTDVFIICLSVNTRIAANLYFLSGFKSYRRIIDVSKVADYIFDTLKRWNMSKEVLMESLIGFHSFTGCDTISTLAGRGKVKPLKLILNHASYVRAFSQLGNQTEVVDLQIIKSFVCHMYVCKGDVLVDKLRYKLYCNNAGKIVCDQLPPCTDALELHFMRANYEVRIWRESLLQIQSDMGPLENGWSLDDDGGFSINWMKCNPVPDEVRL